MDESPTEPTPPSIRRSSAVLDAAPWLAMAVLCGVVIVMGAVASARGWIPTGDDAFLSLRTRHVLSSHPILLNNASSAGPSAGSQYNHPGAFPLTLLTPVTLLGGPGSLALATALVNAAWIALSLVMVRRIAGPTAQAWATVGAALLAWSMGGTFLVDPWNPNYAVWPTVAMVIATWGVWRRHHRLLGPAVVAASCAFQTHLSVTVMAAATAALALVGFVLHARRTWPVTEDRRTLVRSFAIAAAVGLVANAQMLADQFFRTGNLAKILEGTGFNEATVTVRQVAGVLAAKLAVPPMWFRGSWGTPVLPDELPSVAATLVGLAVVTAITVAAAWWARRHDRALASLLGVIVFSVAISTAVSYRFPLRIGIPLPYFRWVWPLAALWTMTVLAIGARAAGARAPWVRVPALPLAAVAAVIALAALIPANESLSPNPEWAQDISHELSAAAVDATGDANGPVLIEQSIQEAALWVIPALIDQLDAAGIDVRMTDPILVQQTSEAYRSSGGETATLWLRGGFQIDDAPPGATEVARYDALTPTQRDDLEAGINELGPALAVPGAIRLTASGAAATDVEALGFLTSGVLPPAELMRSVPLRDALRRDALEVDGVDRARLDRVLDLGALDGGRSIALYLTRRG